MNRKLDENPKINASKCRAALLWNRDGDEIKKGGAGDHRITGRGEISSGEKRWTETDQSELTTRPTGTLSVDLH